MSRNRMRIRRAMLVVTLAMLAVVLAAWGVSYWREASLDYTQKSLEADDSSSLFGVEFDAQVWSIGGFSENGWLIVQTYTFEGKGSALRRTIGAPLVEGWSAGTRVYASIEPLGERVVDSLRVDLSWKNPANWSVPGIRVRRWSSVLSCRRSFSLSYWLFATVLAGGAIWLGLPLRREARRAAEGLCPRCGYDRRGLAPAAACPECGETPAPAPPAA